MAQEPFDVDPELLRAVAREVAGDAQRLARGLGGAPDTLSVSPVDGWRCGAALTELDAAVRRWSGTLAARVAGVAGALGDGADGYEAVDDRAARRLSGVPR
ncbi:type VII secretion target [Micromonospora sp. DT31]|uniref:type VII secretion target n=1 Tax=Micromonospora sp. DT31 TaxID=3393434 RepID=UPI003CED0F6C